jgi:hypothetical protein
MRPRIVISLILGVALGVAVRLISGVAVPRMTWIPLVATVAVGALALLLAIIGMPSDVGQEVGPEASATNPLSGSPEARAAQGGTCVVLQFVDARSTIG